MYSKNIFFKILVGLVSVLLLYVTISCATYMGDLSTTISEEKSKFQKYEQSSPFYSLPITNTGDINFFVDFNGFWKGGVFNVEMFYSFELNNLLFLKIEDEKYRSDFTVRMIVYDDEENYIFDKKWEESIIADNYELTKIDQVIIEKNVFQIEPGEYIFVCSFEDNNSKRSASSVRRNIIIEPFKESELVLSDIKYANYKSNLLIQEEPDTTRLGYESIQHVNRTFNDSLIVYYEIYNNELPVKIEYSIFDSDEKQVLPDTVRIDTVINSKTIHFKTSDLGNGLYILNIKVYKDSLSTGISKQFKINKGSFALSGNFEETIRLIETYIKYERNSLNKLKDSEPGKERIVAWKEFWEQFDPTPITEENEYLNEFSKRVNFADVYFQSPPFKGSKTDMGRIYICLGPPNVIYYENMPRWGNSYEVWEYYRSFKYTNARRFVFYDRTGLGVRGDYRLVDLYYLPRWFEY